MVRTILKGAKRRTKSRGPGGIDLFWLIEAIWYSKGKGGLCTLSHWEPLVIHSGVRDDLKRLWRAYYVVELIGEVGPENLPSPGLYRLSSQVLEALGRKELSRERGSLVFLVFLARVLVDMGTGLRTTNCVDCGGALTGNRPIALAAREGGFRCGNCRHPVDGPVVTAGSVALLSVLADGEVLHPQRVRATGTQLRELWAVLGTYIDLVVGKPLRLTRAVAGTFRPDS